MDDFQRQAMLVSQARDLMMLGHVERALEYQREANSIAMAAGLPFVEVRGLLEAEEWEQMEQHTMDDAW